jgi:S-DNA-T family DNA segregation ATPase FtsK/SpoIIIE
MTRPSTRPARPARPANKKKIQPAAAPPPPAPPRPNPFKPVLDRLVRVFGRLDRFGLEFLGLGLLALAVIVLLGLLHLTEGAFISFFIRNLLFGFGYGSYLVVIILSVLGLFLLRRRASGESGWPRLALGRIVALEGWFFIVLALLSVWGGRSLERVEQGLDGGMIGWGLAAVLSQAIPDPWLAVLLVILLLFFTLIGFGLVGWAERKIEAWLLAPEQELEVEVETPIVSQSAPILKPATEAVQPAAVVKANPPKDKKPARLNIPESVPSKVSQQPRPDYLPPLESLAQDQSITPDEKQISTMRDLIERTLAEFGIPARVVGYRFGPTITQYAVEPGYTEKTGSDGQVVRQKVRVSQISALSRDLALRLSAERLRIEAPVPGQSYVGIEVPNPQSSVVRLRSLLETPAFTRLKSPLAFVLGRDVSGEPLVADLAKMPHILIAGTTGSGKSVCIEALTACLIMNNSPDQLRLVMLDPKMVELVRFNGLPHLFGKVETDLSRMLGVLKWALAEMDARYRLLESAHVRDLDSYNKRMERSGQEPLPRIVIMIDELADLMMSAPDQTETSLARLAQMARATGIHLVVATQRPSTDVVTGIIKANFPARIAFTVATSIDSRVILDTNGAETLLGRGDLLFLNPEQGSPVRAQGVWVTDQEVEQVVSFWQHTRPADKSEAAPWESLLATIDEEGPDDLVKQAVEIVKQSQRASASLLQRRLRIGYPRAARLIDQLEELGVVGPSQGGGREREVLMLPDEEAEEEDGGEDEG